MANSYLDLQTIKGSGGLNIGTTVYDRRLRTLAEHVSRQVDQWCNRHFYYLTGTRDFDGDGSVELLVPDLIGVGTLLEDSNSDGTFETTWGSNDYLLYPLNAQPTAADRGQPYRKVRVNPNNGTQDTFLAGHRNYRVVGTWGYWQVTRDSAVSGTVADATSTSITLSGSATTNAEIGHTVVLDSEQMYVTGATGTALTVERAANGSTGTAHSAATVKVVEYPGPVIEAVFIQTARLWRRKDSAFSNFIVSADSSQSMAFRAGIDPDLRMLLGQYRKLVV